MMETNMDRLIQYAMQEFPEGTTDEELEFYRRYLLVIGILRRKAC